MKIPKCYTNHFMIPSYIKKSLGSQKTPTRAVFDLFFEQHGTTVFAMTDLAVCRVIRLIKKTY